MKHNFYGRAAFVIDLTLVSIWAFFFSRYCGAGLLILVPVRIALSFEMRRRSAWSLVSAVGFLTAYSSTLRFIRPFERMVYNFGCVFSDPSRMFDIFSMPLTGETALCTKLLAALWFIWLAVMPVGVGICLANVREIRWSRKGIWIYLIPLTLLSMWMTVENGYIGLFLLGITIAALPAFYWLRYDRQGRSPVQLLLDDRRLLWYCFYILLFGTAFTIGFRDLWSLKPIGLLMLPAAFYIALTLSMKLGTALTRCCVMLSLAGFLVWLSLDCRHTGTVILLATAICLVIAAGGIMLVKTRKLAAPLILAITVPTVIIPFVLGLNPYVVTDAEHLRMYTSNPAVRKGVYVVEKYAELSEKGTPHYWRINHGLRDRYGLILPMKYNEIRVIDGHGRYIMTNRHLPYGSPKSDQRYGVFDLFTRTFIVDPDEIVVSEMKKTDDNTYRLMDPEGRHIATLLLPGTHNGSHCSDARLKRLQKS